MDLSFRRLSEYLFGAQKKEAERREAQATGVWLLEVTGEETKKQKNLLYVCNAVLNFLIVFGMTGCVMEGLAMKWSPAVLFLILFAAAVWMGFFYRNRWFRLFGYIMVVGGILLSLQQFLLLFRSGFALICNRLMHIVEEELSLPIEREYEIYVENHDLAVVMCLVLIGVVMELFFNIIISEMKNYWIVLLFSFPFVQLPIYLNQKLPVFYFILYCAGIVAMYAIRSSGHFGVPQKKQAGFIRRKLGKKNYIIYRYDGESSFGVTLAVAAAALLVMLGFVVVYPAERFEAGHAAESVWKENSRSFARRFALVGFWGMFSNTGEEGAGGVGTGKLGTINRVRMDFEPDFYIYTTKSEKERTLYLRSFCGREYKDNEWSVEMDSHEQEYCIHFQPADEFLYLDFMDTGLFSTAAKELLLENAGAGMQYVYYPYWNVADAENVLAGEGRGTKKRLAVGNLVKQEYQVLFGEPSVAEIKDLVQKSEENRTTRLWSEFIEAEEAYRRIVYDTYLQVEQGQKERLLSLCRQNGILPEDGDVVEKVQDFLQENYTYTLMPGVTPKNTDFVDYFLFEQRKGYCIYFASAATLIFRSLGIPARYVCGYAAFSDVFSDAKRIEDEQLSNWLGAGEFYRLELTDANAHAWVEIYIDGFGWLPVEVTTAMTEEEEETQADNFAGLQQFIAGLFRPEMVAAARKTTIRFGILVLGAGLLALAATPVVCRILSKKRKKSFLAKDAGAAVCAMYRHLNLLAGAAGCRGEKGSNYRRRGEELADFFGFSPADLQELVRLMEQARFSSRSVTKEEQRAYFEKTKELSEAMLLRIKQPKRFWLGMAYRF